MGGLYIWYSEEGTGRGHNLISYFYISGYCTTTCSWIPASPRRFCSQLLDGDSLPTTHRRYRSLTPSSNRQPQSKVSALHYTGILHSTSTWPTCVKPATSTYARCATCPSPCLMLLPELSPGALSAQGLTIATHCLLAWLTATLRNCIVYRIH